MLSEGVPGLEGPEGEGGVFLVSLRSQRVWLEKVETCEKIFGCSLVNLYLPVSFFPYYFGPASPGPISHLVISTAGSTKICDISWNKD